MGDDGGMEDQLADVQIVMTEDLPDSIACAAEFGPTFIHLAVRPCPNVCDVVADAIAAMMDSYDRRDLEALRPVRPSRAIA